MMTRITADAAERDIRFRKNDIDVTFRRIAEARGVTTDNDWKRFEKEQARRERQRLIRSGVIRPAFLMQPQMMVKHEGKWVPEVKIYV